MPEIPFWDRAPSIMSIVAAIPNLPGHVNLFDIYVVENASRSTICFVGTLWRNFQE